MGRNKVRPTTVAAYCIEDAAKVWNDRRAVSDFYEGTWYVYQESPGRFKFSRSLIPAIKNTCDGDVWKLTQRPDKNSYKEMM